jgi:glycosyltransferase involved in cell wall biosynthesis
LLVSVVVTNYNYGRFLRQALDSALAQTHDAEVVLVDDGSTDDSREILADYDNRVKVLLQENAGQRAAVNAGIAASSGDVVCLLDADDVFAPEKVERVVDSFEGGLSPCLVYHQLQTIDADGRPKGRPFPRAVLRGDIRARVERSAGWWPRPTTSAFAFSRALLERLLPMATGHEDPWPDTYLSGVAPFVGPIAGIAEPLASLRLHGSNAHSRGKMADQPDPADDFRARRDHYRREFDALADATRDRLGIDAKLSIDDHLRYQQYSRAAGDPVSLARVMLTAARCPSLPLSMRWREVVKVATGRW